MYRYITLLTDFGLDDDFAGVCRGVIRRIAPEVELLDLTHGVAPQAVTAGAIVLARAIPYLPVGVHFAVVDPGVGSERRALALETADGRVYVGPDNGLLSLAAPSHTIVRARSLTNARYHLEEVSRTFHARDVFAPVAAHLAAGADFDDLGAEVDPATIVALDLPEPELGLQDVHGTVVRIDRFGNLELNLGRKHVDALGVEPGDRVELRFQLDRYYAIVGRTFADAKPGELLLYEDSYGVWAIAISGGNARRLIGAAEGDRVRISPAPDWPARPADDA